MRRKNGSSRVSHAGRGSSALRRPGPLAWSLAVAFAAVPAGLLANPTGGVAVVGSATYQSAGNTLTVTTQNGAGLAHSAINWQSFSIPSGSTTNFVQPNATSTVINRVVTNTPSQIFGTLSSNGKIVLVNQSGITVGAGAVVDTAGFTASVLGMSDADAQAGRLRFAADNLGQANGQLRVDGNIIARTGDVVLIAPNVQVAQTAVVEAPNGSVVLAAGQQVEVTGRGLEGITMVVQAPTDSAVNLGTLRGDAVGIFAGTLRHSGLIQATGVTVEGGKVVLKASGTADVAGRIEATKVVAKADGSGTEVVGGTVSITGRVVTLTGDIAASGVQGGQVDVAAYAIAQSGTIAALATGAQRQGGTVNVIADRTIEQTVSARIDTTSAAGQGGNVRVQATDADNGSVLSSATLVADGAQGGTVEVYAPTVYLQAATVSADGTAAVGGDGGNVYLGGGKHGEDPLKPNSRYLAINATTVISSRARRGGNGGNVVLWSDGTTHFDGNINARGGVDAGNGGFIEVSGKESVVFRGMADAGATHGAKGTLLLDPANITITDGGGGSLTATGLLTDAEALTASDFGTNVAYVDGKVVVTDPNNNALASQGGALFVFDPTTGALYSSLRGDHAADRVGASFDVNPLNGSELILTNASWNGNRGAITLFSLASSTTQVVSSANSFVGAQSDDAIGNYGYQVLTGSSSSALLFLNPQFNNNAGAVILVPASGGTRSGVVSASTALVGGFAGDRLGDFGYTNQINTLAGHDEIIMRLPGYNSGEGAFYIGKIGQSMTGTISASTALVGGSGGGFASQLQMDWDHGYVLVTSPYWTNGSGVYNVGAVTRISLASPVTGTVSASNSLVGTNAYDQLGSDGVHINADGSYVVFSSNWGGDKGAVTWGTAASGVVGTVNATPVTGNSLVGNAGTHLGQIKTQDGDKFILLSPFWTDDPGVADNKGAITVLDGKTKMPGTVSASNSIVGSYANDYLGCYASVSDCGESASYYTGAFNMGGSWYEINSVNWNSQTGASTFVYLGSGSTANDAAAKTPRGIVSDASTTNLTITGENAGDRVGDGYYNTTPNYYYSGVLALRAPNWSDGRGAIMLLNLWNLAGSDKMLASNTIHGTTSDTDAGFYSAVGDRVGNQQGFWSDDTHYILVAPDWNYGRGAVGAYTVGATGPISSSNALVGSTGYDNAEGYYADHVGGGYVDVLSGSGNIIVSSPDWNQQRGAVTIANVGSLTGVVNSSNSMVGENAGDAFGPTGSDQVLELGSTVVVLSPYWRGDQGAITWIDQSSPGGTVNSSTNSLVGNSGDHVGSGGFAGPGTNAGYDLPYNLVLSPSWGTGEGGSKGAITKVDTNVKTGTVDASNSFVGATEGDNVGLNCEGYCFNTYTFSNGAWIMSSQLTANRVAFTVFAPNSDVVGTIGNSNSIIELKVSSGSENTDWMGGSLLTDSNWGNRAILWMPGWGSSQGALRVIDTDLTASAGVTAAINTGATGSGNALVGAPGDLVGGGNSDPYYNPRVWALQDGRVLIFSPHWGGDKGAVTVMDTANPIHGTITSGNSLVGASSDDFGGISNPGGTLDFRGFDNGDQVAFTRYYGGGQGAIFYIDHLDPTTGVLGAGNALVGGVGFTVGGFNAFQVAGGWVISAPDWGTSGSESMGFASLFTTSIHATGVVDSSNSLVGTAAGDRVGNFVWTLDGNKFVVGSPQWSGGTGTERGALTWATSDTALTGTVSAANSLVGDYDYDHVGAGFGEGGTDSPIGQLAGASNVYYVLTHDYQNNHGAVSFVQWGESGGLAARSTLVSPDLYGMDANNGWYYQPMYLTDGLYAVRFAGQDLGGAGPGRVYLTNGQPGGGATIPQTFGLNPDQDVTITNGTITAITNTGTDVLLQANNDINIDADIVTNGSPAGGLTFEAGRSVIVNGNITTNGGNLAIIANSGSENVQQSYRAEGAGEIVVSRDKTINYGSGTALLKVDSEGWWSGDITIYGTVTGSGDLTVTTPNYLYVTDAGSAARLQGGNVSIVADSGLQVSAYYAGASIIATNSLSIDADHVFVRTNGPAAAQIVSAGNAGISTGYGDIEVYAGGEGGGTASIAVLGALNASSSTGGEGGGGLYVHAANGGTARIVAGSLSYSGQYLTVETDGGSSNSSASITVSGALNVNVQNGFYVAAEGLGSASVSAGSANVNADWIEVDGGYGPAAFVTSGAMTLTTNDVYISGGWTNGASATIASGGDMNITSNYLELYGGSGTGAFALLDPVNPGSTMTLAVNQITLQGGDGDGSYAAIVSQGGNLNFSGPLPTITFTPGAGAGSDAVIYAPNGEELAALFGSPYLGDDNPLPNGVTQFGFAKVKVAKNYDQSDLLAGLDWIAELLDPEHKRRREDDVVFEVCPVE